MRAVTAGGQELTHSQLALDFAVLAQRGARFQQRLLSSRHHTDTLES